MSLPQALALALAHHQAGRLAEAESIYRQILAVAPDHADALHFLGVLAAQSGRHELAVQMIRQSLALQPQNVAALSNYGEACRKLGALDEAIAAYRRALQLQPDVAEIQSNLGNALADRGALDEAIAACRRAIELRPDFAEAWSNLGGALRETGALDEAVAACRRAIELRPEYAESHGNLGNALRDLGLLGGAIAAHRRMIELKPHDAIAHSNLGAALSECGLLDEAIAEYRRAAELDPRCAPAWSNLGNALKETAQLDEALDCYRRASELRPADAATHSNLVYATMFHPRFDRRALREERARWVQRHSPVPQPLPIYANTPDPARRLRIGYVSPDFRDHVIARNLLPLFENHDRGDFEIVCYSGTLREDAMTARFRSLADRWRTTHGMSDADLAGLVRSDEVDILVDLTQHMAGNRLTMFARMPAPVQISFAGYPDGTGMPAIGHRIGDVYLEPEPAEGVLRAESFWCYDPRGIEAEPGPLPALARGAPPTFGCLNNFSKVTDDVLGLWAQVLRAVEGSRLLVASPAGRHRARATDLLRGAGVEAERVEWVAPCPRREYLERYRRLDVALDTFPYNGHTTTLDALWMGVPVVSLAGETPVSRAGLSILSHLGVPGWVAQSRDEYVRIAAGLAGDLPALAGWRATLRDRMKNSPLLDAGRFARSIEAAYRQAWTAWCRSHGAPTLP